MFSEQNLQNIDSPSFSKLYRYFLLHPANKKFKSIFILNTLPSLSTSNLSLIHFNYKMIKYIRCTVRQQLRNTNLNKVKHSMKISNFVTTSSWILRKISISILFLKIVYKVHLYITKKYKKTKHCLAANVRSYI